LEHQNVVRGAEFQLKQKLVEKYIKYKFPTSHSVWKDLWFHIGNHKPLLAERTGGVPKPQPEWNQNPLASEMEQVNEPLDVIQALKLMGVTGASVMYSFLSAEFSLCKRGVNLVSIISDMKIPPGCLYRNCHREKH
jgi:hypothetical protein